MKNIFIVIATIIGFSYFLLSIDEATNIYSNDKIAAISMNDVYNQVIDGSYKEYSGIRNINAFINNKRINNYYVTGNIKDGYLDGRIEIRDINLKIVFEGDLELGVYAGHARFYDKYGVTYEGYVKNGVQDGFGRNILFEDGIMRWMYEGDFKDGMKNGYGVLTVFSEETGIKEYEGVFKNDVFNGKYYKTEKLFVPKIDYIKMKSTDEELNETKKIDVLLNKIKKSNNLIVKMINEMYDDLSLEFKDLIDKCIDKVDAKNKTIDVFNETKNNKKELLTLKNDSINTKKENIRDENVTNDTKNNIRAKTASQSFDENKGNNDNIINELNNKEKFANELKLMIEELIKNEMLDNKKLNKVENDDSYYDTIRKINNRVENLVRSNNEVLEIFSIEEALVIARRILIDEKFVNDSNETKKIKECFVSSDWSVPFIPYALAMELNTSNLKEEINREQIEVIKKYVEKQIKNMNIV